jgi:phosphoribosylaminoimidazolecarboxamide formyltransferase/IMP cyclohydrolase
VAIYMGYGIMTDLNFVKIRRALVSVSDKEGIIDFARVLKDFNIEIISTGGTAKALMEAGIPVVGISDVTGFPEMMDGRVKTLHPRVHGGLLARRDIPEHMNALQEHGIPAIDMVVVNLYPFARTVAREGVSLEEAIENIDIGGPSMIRSAAKNFAGVAVVVDPSRYVEIAEELKANKGALSYGTREKLAVEAFNHTAAYDGMIFRYLSGRKEVSYPKYPKQLPLSLTKIQDLRYGENPHQSAAFYAEGSSSEPSVANAKQLWGKELSFNNIIDIDAALEIIKDFIEPAAVVIKHTNPCGTAIADNITEAYKRAYAADPLSAFGGIVGLSMPVNVDTASELAGTFLEAVIAPGYSPEALEVLKTKKNLRVLSVTDWKNGYTPSGFDMKKVTGGMLIQDRDTLAFDRSAAKVVTEAQPDERDWCDLAFAWKMVKHLKSNAILLAADGVTVGVGVGQMSRVDAAELAVKKAQGRAEGAVMASDAFFPFRDAIDAAAAAGIRAIIQPGGSIRDEEVIAAANEHGITMVFTGYRHFKH